MAESNVPITPGSGFNVDGFIPTGASVFRQSIVQGDPTTSGNIVAVINSSLATVSPQFAATEMAFMYGQASATIAQAITTDGKGNLNVNPANAIATVNVSNFPANNATTTIANFPAVQNVIATIANTVTVSGTVTQAVVTLSIGNLANANATVSNDGSFAKETGGNVATIATNTGNSATSANQTNGTQQTKITNGMNVADVAPNNSATTGSAGNFVETGGTGFTTSTISLSAGTQATSWFDMLNYAWVSVEILTNTTPATLTFQTSGDASQTNISSALLTITNSASTNPVSSTTSAIATFHGPRQGRYFRINSNLAGGNTATLVLTFFTYPSGSLGQYNVTGSFGSATPTGSAVPANAFYMAYNSGGNLTGFTSQSQGDGVGSNPSFVPYLYNGTNTDRTRNNTTGVVIAASTTLTALVTLATYNASKMALVVNVATISSGAINLSFNGLTSSGYSYPLLSTIASITTAGVNVYRVAPGLTPSAGLVANDLVPRYVMALATGTFSGSFGIDYELSV